MERIAELEAHKAALRQQVTELTQGVSDNAALRQQVAEWTAKFVNLKRQGQARSR
jgi:hypothetical protein